MAGKESGIKAVSVDSLVQSPINILNYVKGIVIPKEKADIISNDIFDDYGYFPLFRRLNENTLVIVGLIDVERWEKWWVGKQEPTLVLPSQKQTKLLEVM